MQVAGCHCLFKNKLLLLKRCSHKPQANRWGHPAGKLDPGEDPVEGLLREIKEETNITLSKSNVAFVATVYVRYPAIDFVYHIFKTTFDTLPDNIVLHDDEHQSFAWVAKKAALEMELVLGEKECLTLLME